MFESQKKGRWQKKKIKEKCLASTFPSVNAASCNPSQQPSTSALFFSGRVLNTTAAALSGDRTAGVTQRERFCPAAVGIFVPLFPFPRTLMRCPDSLTPFTYLMFALQSASRRAANQETLAKKGSPVWPAVWLSGGKKREWGVKLMVTAPIVLNSQPVNLGKAEESAWARWVP